MSVLTTHPQVHLSWGGIEADVDEGLAKTILALWRGGFETSYSCVGHGHLRETTPGGSYEAPYIVFSRHYPMFMEIEIQEALIEQGWVVLDVFAWESPADDVPTRTVARFCAPGTTI